MSPQPSSFVGYIENYGIKSESDLNSLLVKHQVDNPSPGAVTGGN